MKSAPFLASLLAVALALSAADALAQGYPRRDRGSSPRESNRDDTRERDRDLARAAAAADPFAALERELPSLKDDLRLTTEQADAWSVFERDVRDAAEGGRARRRHILALGEGGDKAPTALALMASLAEDQRVAAEASADARRHLEALYARLDDAQRRMLDRRVVLSQTQPLGR